MKAREDTRCGPLVHRALRGLSRIAFDSNRFKMKPRGFDWSISAFREPPSRGQGCGEVIASLDSVDYGRGEVVDFVYAALFGADCRLRLGGALTPAHRAYRLVF